MKLHYIPLEGNSTGIHLKSIEDTSLEFYARITTEGFTELHSEITPVTTGQEYPIAAVESTDVIHCSTYWRFYYISL